MYTHVYSVVALHSYDKLMKQKAGENYGPPGTNKLFYFIDA